jgi:hypothetical protein
MAHPIRVEDYVDLDRYPVDDPGSPGYAAMMYGLHAALERDGCAVLKGFVRPERISALAAEADRVAPDAHRSFNRTNAYFTLDDPTLAPEHPRRRYYDRSNAFVPADNFGPQSILRAIYAWPAFSPFIQAALQEESFFPYADPLADVIVNVVEPGGGFPWHFDTNNFTVTLAIQNGQSGGEFQYAPNLRSADDENYEGVRAVLDGTSGKVRTLVLEPGDLQIFKGRYSLHRVAPVEGSRNRYVGIFSYVAFPDMVGRVERTRQLYGRVLPIHLEREGLRADALVD